MIRKKQVRALVAKQKQKSRIPGHSHVDTHGASAGNAAADQRPCDIHGKAVSGGTKQTPGHVRTDAHSIVAGSAAADQKAADAHVRRVGGGIKQTPGQAPFDAHEMNAGSAAADHTGRDIQNGPVSGGTNRIADICGQIHAFHVRRRFALKLQQKIDRSLESYVRINETDWSPDLPSAERDKINTEVARIIKAARAGEGDEMLVTLVSTTDQSRAPGDALRATCEKNMIALARQLPVHDWVASVHGAGTLGLATIIGEAYSIHHPGGLEQYANPAKLWKRLGFAPYEGFAGSTWKRETWRPRSLTSEEWIANPFSGQRYAPMRTIATWLVNHQIVAAKKNDGVAKANGCYGEIYLARRAHTAVTHPEWTPAHSQSDALRVTMKAFLKDLWNEWRKSLSQIPGHGRNDAQRMIAGSAAADQSAGDAQTAGVGGGTNHELPANEPMTPQPPLPGIAAADHTHTDAQSGGVGGGSNRTPGQTQRDAQHSAAGSAAVDQPLSPMCDVSAAALI